MDINEAALKLAKIEIVKKQIEHLQKEAGEKSEISDRGFEYSRDCNEKAQELIRMVNINSLFQ